MTGSETAVVPRRPLFSAVKGNGHRRWRRKKGVERDGLRRRRVHLSHSFLFILLVCSPPLLIFYASSSPPPSSTHFCFALFQRLPRPPLPLFFSSLCLPREKRFCLLLVSAPSQSAFLISSYCFCLIFKCYPGPNGNPHTKKEVSGESEGKRNRLGIVFHSRTPRQKPPSTLSTLRERFGGFWGAVG